MSNESVETQAVAALAAVQQIGVGMPDMHPMRHQVRAIKREAAKTLEEAFNRARQLAYLAGDAISDHDKAVSEGGTHEYQDRVQPPHRAHLSGSRQ